MPAEEQTPATPSSPAPVIIRPGTDAPQAVYRAFNAQRRELAGQVATLEEKQRELARQLSNPTLDKSVRAGLEQRVGELDKRISEADKQLAAADQAVAKAAAVPGAVIEPPRRDPSGPPESVVVMSCLFMVMVFFPLSIALALRIWKRGTTVVAKFPQELADRLNRVDQSLDAIALEVERIGEGQRFVTRVMTENGRAIGAGPAQPIDLAAGGEKTRVSRESDRI
jgi:hypothetical protein